MTPQGARVEWKGTGRKRQDRKLDREAEIRSQADRQDRDRLEADDRDKQDRAGLQQPWAPLTTVARGRRHQPQKPCYVLGLCCTGAPIYLHGPEIQEFLRAASRVASVQQVGGLAPAVA